ncbi:MAG: sensor histidine kinase [Thermoanaerobaculia bacterium]
MELTTQRKRIGRGLALWAGSVVLFGLLLFVYHYLEIVASRGSEPPLEPFINEMTGALAAGLMFFPILWLVRRRPLTRGTWRRRLPVYGLVHLALAFTATSLIWGLRTLLYPLAGLGAFDYGVMPVRYFMELPLQTIAFAVIVAALHVRLRELRTAQVEANLARAQLQNLRLQLQPHFLFNALNTISATMYEDPAAADEMLGALSDLLRSSLKTVRTDEVPLREELELLDSYLVLLRARFGERLAVSIEVDPSTADALVPSLLLQPLVENAIRHGNAEKTGRGTVAVRARRDGPRLILEVEDDGPGDSRRNGTPVEGESEGIGLAATAKRLRMLYGAYQSFTAGDGPSGGFLARAVLPLRTPQ